MNDLQIQPETPSPWSRPQSELEALSAELTKMLVLVAPVTMTAQQQALWLGSAVDALKDIRASEVAAVSLKVRRSITRYAQIVPEISRLVAERRKSAGESARRNAELEAPPKHILNRDRRKFRPADWAELNECLERMGAGARYRSDGSRYLVGS